MTDLADLDPEDLATELIALAREARKLSAAGDVAKLHGHLERVRASAAVASGERLALLEVAEAFLRALARTDVGKSELALRRLFTDHFAVATKLFRRLLKPASVDEAELAGLSDEARGRVDELIELGVLRREGKGYELRPSMRALARDLLEPATLRMWRRVHEARGHIALARMKPEAAAGYLSAQLGITQVEAEAHLTTNRIEASQIARIGPTPRPARVVSRTFAEWLDTPSVSGTDASEQSLEGKVDKALLTVKTRQPSPSDAPLVSAWGSQRGIS